MKQKVFNYQILVFWACLLFSITSCVTNKDMEYLRSSNNTIHENAINLPYFLQPGDFLKDLEFHFIYFFTLFLFCLKNMNFALC